MSLLTSVLVLLTSSACSPLPREADHYFNTRELWARRRALFTPINLPTALRLQAKEVVDHTNNDIVPTLLEDDIKDIDPQKEVKMKASTTEATTTKQSATVLKE